MNRNLDSLKDEMLAYLKENDFVVFHGFLGELEPLSIPWDTGRYPDYQLFLHTARRASAPLIIFHHQEFSSFDLEAAQEVLEEADLPYEEVQTYRRRIKEFEGYEGFTCQIHLGFHLNRLYSYRLTADWFMDFEDLMDELQEAGNDFDDEEFDEDDEPMGGYFSKN
jgi:hypothetical protein